MFQAFSLINGIIIDNGVAIGCYVPGFQPEE
jgi:hypothetical protein